MKEKVLLLLLLISSFSYPLMAQGNLMIFPKRITFDGIKNKMQIINLSNVGKDSATYIMSYNQIKMDENGKFIAIEEPEPNQRFASPYLRFYPRTITLAPNGSQTVKIQLIKTNELQQGEFRSHLYFRGVPKNRVLDEEEPLYKPENLNISIAPVFGISIANIITIGEISIDVALSNLEIQHFEEEIILSLDFNRSGNNSCYGDIQVNHISATGITTSITTVKGFAVYAPGNLRRTKIKLINTTNIDYTKGKLQVIYSTQDKGIKYAEASLSL